ncbi:hypothetical protein EFS38_11785 [Dickeya undicola]|uniref:Uncharacterized protein n=1 Tax=Dickeya undicola TaxID=1577887 RepID=A0ABX9WSL0_9GAMM|nr:hypothetical protein EFS38_11785 [Dickeya undicola]
MVIVTKVPLGGYYFPDDDEMTGSAHVFMKRENQTVSDILAAAIRKKSLLAHSFASGAVWPLFPSAMQVV